jgi:hypothetical protein
MQLLLTASVQVVKLDSGIHIKIVHHIVVAALEFYETVITLMTCKLDVLLKVLANNAK